MLVFAGARGDRRVMQNPIPDDVRRFILSNALTVPDVEALLMFRACGNVGCTVDLLASRLYIPQSRAREVVAKLQSMGTLLPDDSAASFVYRPRTSELSAVLEALLTCYTTNLVPVAQLIHSAETQSAQAFADAFRIHKET